MIVLRLALASLRARLGMFALTLALIAMSAALVIGVDKVRFGARAGFAGTISGTDLIMGARGGGVQLLLYSVFRIGDAPNNVTWASYQDIAQRPDIAWIVPISRGDSRRGHRVMGTTPDLFDKLRYRDGAAITFAAGGVFDDLFDVVIGAEVAEKLGYAIGDQIVLAHGAGSVSLVEHSAYPFKVLGILAPTRTPMHKAVYTSLGAIEAIHVDWQTGAAAANETAADALRRMDLTPKSITAAFIGLNSPLTSFALQREINAYPAEPLSAILPSPTQLVLCLGVGFADGLAGLWPAVKAYRTTLADGITIRS